MLSPHGKEITACISIDRMPLNSVNGETHFVPGQSSEVRALRGHVQPDLPQRRLRPPQPQGQIRVQAHLRKFRMAENDVGC